MVKIFKNIGAIIVLSLWALFALVLLIVASLFQAILIGGAAIIQGLKRLNGRL